MPRQLLFKQIHYDTKLLTGSETISFFNDSDLNEESVTSMTEDQAVKWLFQNPDFLLMFLPDFFENPNKVKSFFGLTEPFTQKNNKPGDIDLLLVDIENPDIAIAFECKRVKSVSLEDQTAKVNNTEKIKHGVLQVNKYQKLGFHQTYLMIILLDDGRNYRTPNTLFRSTNIDELKQLYDLPFKEPLHTAVGVIFIILNQPTGNDINLTGAIAFCLDKPAEILEQKKSLTSKIESLIMQNLTH